MTEYKIFSTLEDFYNWQGKNGNPAEGTVNYIMNYSTNNANKTYRYTYPHPHPSATWDKDSYGMPENITGNDLRVCCVIDENCPSDKLPSDLKTLDQVLLEGWFDEPEE